MQPKESKTNKHFRLSMVKSLIRIIGFGEIFFDNIGSGAILLIIAEIIGIFEEF
jgi:hypothetical protein